MSLRRKRSRIQGAPARWRADAWLTGHARAFLFSLGQLVRAPANTLMTAAVIGIALALPAGLLVLLEDLRDLGRGLDTEAQVSLFLQPTVPDESARRLASELERRRDVARVEVIDRLAALAEYSRASGFGEAVALLDENPLPAVLVVHPRADASTAAAVEAFAAAMERRPEVAVTQVDRAWLQRLHAMTALARQAVLVLAVLLGVAVLLVVGNTIRLGIANRRAEIDIAQLVGATDAFVRRPFLYHGALLGVFGALMAWVTVVASLLALQGPVSRLASLYGSGFSLGGPGLAGALLLLLTGGGLGLLGAWVAVAHQLASLRRRTGSWFVE
ncbi:MAG: ABC transporter permease [Gammaproteobacteria bacterium]|nr:ABC transporter permease [Gammaproteobacteria bacterium]